MAESVAAQAQTPDYLRCFVLPLQMANLLLPATVVVEVSSHDEPLPEEGTPEWYRGVILWRGLMIPLVSYESFLGVQAQGERHRMVVLNTLNQNENLPFVAIEIDALPRLIQLKADGVQSESVDADVDAGFVLGKVKITDDEAYVPDIDTLENILIDMGVKVGQ